MKRVLAAVMMAGLIVSSCADGSKEGVSSTSPTSDPVAETVSATTHVSVTTLPSTVAQSSTTLSPTGVRACRPEDAADEGVTTVTLWSTLNVDAELLLNELIVRFNTLHADVQVNLQYSEDPLSLLRRLRAGERPDLMIMGVEGLVNLDDSGILTAVDECLANDPSAAPDDLLPIAAATYQLGGRQIAMPLSVSTPVLYFDRAKVRLAGLDPDRPPADLTQLAEQISTMQAAGVVADGLTYADATWFITQLAAQHGITLATAGNGHDRPATAVRATLTDTGLADVLAPIGEMAAAGLITTPVRNESGFDDLLRLIDREQPAAMALHTSGAASRVYDLIGNDPGSGVEVGIAPMPGPVGGALVGGSALWITTPEPATAWAAW
ncbi:MAG: extracellular solute-binding protein, partial [Ilumatobacteraceae bacterium]